MVAESQTDLLGRSQNLVLELGFQGSFQNDSAVFIVRENS